MHTCCRSSAPGCSASPLHAALDVLPVPAVVVPKGHLSQAPGMTLVPSANVPTGQTVQLLVPKPGRHTGWGTKAWIHSGMIGGTRRLGRTPPPPAHPHPHSTHPPTHTALEVAPGHRLDTVWLVRVVNPAGHEMQLGRGLVRLPPDDQLPLAQGWQVLPPLPGAQTLWAEGVAVEML